MKTATIEIIRTTRAYLCVKGSTVATFLPIEGYGVRVVFRGDPWWLAGNQKRVPELTPGAEFNIHKGDPTKSARIRVAST